MPVAVLCCRRPDAVTGGAPSPGLHLRSVCTDRDARAIARLADSVTELPARGVAAPRPRGRGLLAEITSRPDRQVEAWLAVVPAAEDARGLLAGLISLVQCRSATGIRHSIGWVLVHPAARRRGVARALVAQACSRAVELAAEAVWVECRSDWAGAIAFWQAVGFTERPRASTAAGAPVSHTTDMLWDDAEGHCHRRRLSSQERTP